MRDLTPHARGFKHVRFVDRVNTTATFACGLERMANNALDLVFGVHERVISLLAGSAIHACASNLVRAFTFAEIETARELAYDHTIDTIDNGRFERRGVRQRIEDHDRTKVRIQAQAFSNSEQSLFRAWFAGIGSIPLRTADCRKQHRIGARSDSERGFGKRAARFVDRTATNERFGVFERYAMLHRDRIENLHAFSDDLRTDAIAR